MEKKIFDQYIIPDRGFRVDGLLSSKTILNENKKLYRARLHYKEKEEPYEYPKMFCPPPDLSVGGRANPAGIPFLYLCDNKDSVLYEIRAAFLDEVSVGTFVLKNTIEEDITIADFTEVPTLFSQSGMQNEINTKIKSKLLKDKISRDLSKPIRRYDSPLDYIPTQFICEFVKIYSGAHGIKFRSSLHPTGNNIVIFNQDIMECIDVEKAKVKKVVINSDRYI
ncbi:RES family NAD+ phosphorylase [Limibacterium fermenti]|uniref:RES family NAD+ phosphorylase n=1 Tax=Limibacterium fermenti TaxID=3229863 RepID=UPI003A706A07